MKPSQLKKFLIRCIEHRKPVLVNGPPGCAKTDVMIQAATEAGADIIVMHPAISDPTKVEGMPWIDTASKAAGFYPFADFKRALDATRLTVLFFDDLGQASDAMQKATMQVFHAATNSRRIGDHLLPDCVVPMAATNRRTDRAGVSGLLEPVKSRFLSIVELQPDLNDVCDWFIDNGYPDELVGFLRFRPGLLLDFKPTGDLKNSPCPRTWAHVGEILQMRLGEVDPRIEYEAIEGAVGHGAADFVGYLRIARELPPLESIIEDPAKAPIPPPSNPSARYAVMTGLASRATVKNIEAVMAYTLRMYQEAEAGEFAAYLMMDVHRRSSNAITEKAPEVAAIMHSKAWALACAGPLGKLLTRRYDEPAVKPERAATKRGRR